ncbi:MAG: T9SS type A sorting domain-containing protein [Ignavibacteriae bacterium]|nr:T9SS type A sorting domain-containing protein [Ignavibacteriota bacterium]
MNSQHVYSFAVNGNYIYAGTAAASTFLPSFYFSSNGINWSGAGMEYREINALATNGNNVYAGVYNSFPNYGGFYLSTNNGMNWTKTAFNNSYTVAPIEVIGNYIYVGAYNSSNIPGLYFSTNNGYNWTQTSLNNCYVRGIKVIGNNIFAVVYYTNNTGGVYRSTNNGINWAATSLIGDVNTIEVGGNNIFAETTYNLSSGTGGFYYSTNYGTSWVRNNPNFNSNIYLNKILFANDFIFIGSSSGLDLWRRPLSEIIGIQNISSEIPLKYSLSQNYPNPFNPTTNLKFDVPRAGDVKIVVYDLMGREVQTLVNESLKPGTYEISFDGSLLNSGVYFYMITAGNYSESKRMLLIK